MTTTDTYSLKVHVSRDGVWCLDKEGLAERVCDTVGTFLHSPQLAGASVVRLVGMHSNVPLAVALYELKQQNKLESVQLASPLVCQTQAERRSPEVVLYRMRRFVQSPSTGGFHEMTQSDYVAYSLADEMTKSQSVTSRAINLLHIHPAWRSLQFIPTLNEECCATLLGYIMDPRWYVDPCNPDRTARLESKLGLNPKTQAGVTLADVKPWRNHHLCSTVLRCWKDPQQVKAIINAFQCVGPEPATGATTPGLRPGDFLWRIWGYSIGCGPGSREPPTTAVIADLRASCRFIAFLSRVWISAIYESAILPDGGASLFRAADFFRPYLSEAEAYDDHMERLAHEAE